METYQTYNLGNKELRIYQDIDARNPRDEFDNFGTLDLAHSRYNLPNESEMSPDEVVDYLEANRKNLVVLTVYAYEHSGIALSTSNAGYPFDCQWDSGVLGFIHVTYEEIRKEYGVKKVTKKIIERVKAHLEAEIEEYGHYLSGDVFGFELYEISGWENVPEDDRKILQKYGISEEEFEEYGLNADFVNSCWGFYGSNPLENGMIEHLDEETAELLREQLKPKRASN